MGLFSKRKPETRENDIIDDSALRAAIGGQAVTVETAISVPSIAGCVGFIAGIVSSLPVKMYRTNGEKTVEVKDDYRLRLVNCETGDLLDAEQWKTALVRDYLLSGSGYTFVDWQGNKVSGLYYVAHDCVSYQKGIDPVYKAVKFSINGKGYREHEIARLLRNTKDGITGTGVVQENPRHIETMLNAIAYENRTMRTGSKRGFIKSKNRLTQEAINQLRKAWNNLYSSDSSETVVVLNEGLDFQDASQNAVDSQLTQNKEQNSVEICKIFNLSPRLFTGGASEEDNKNSVRYGVMPIVRAFESMLNRFFLLESEKGTLCFEVDTDSLDSADILKRYQAYEIGTRNGWLQLDEVRNEEGRNPLGLDFIKLGLDTVIYDPATKTMYTPNTKEWAELSENGTLERKGDETDEDDNSGR